MVYKIRLVRQNGRGNFARPTKRTSTYITTDQLVLGGVYLLRMNQWYRVEREL